MFDERRKIKHVLVGLALAIIFIILGEIYRGKEPRPDLAQPVLAESSTQPDLALKESSQAFDVMPNGGNRVAQSEIVAHPFPNVPRTRDGLDVDGDPFYAESKAEQRWLDLNGYPNVRQWETYSVASDALLERAAQAGDPVARTMLDVRLLPTDPMAQERLLEAGAEGNLFALSMVSSYQAGSPNGSAGFAYAISKVIEMRGDLRMPLVRDVMLPKSFDIEQRLRAEVEAIKLNEFLKKKYQEKHGVPPVFEQRPIGSEHD